jgi:hypothetical protein
VSDYSAGLERGIAAMQSKAASRPRKPGPVFERRILDFDTPARIRGESGRVMLEPIAKTLKTCPEATLRILARWSGTLGRGELLELEGWPPLEVLAFRPIAKRRQVAHILCRPAPATTHGDHDAAAGR